MAKILVMEDESQLSELFKKMLMHYGHQVLIANDGVEGIKSFHQFNPDLIITDIIMPEKDGIEVIVQVLKETPNIPIIAISGGRRAVTADFNLDSASMLGGERSTAKTFYT